VRPEGADDLEVSPADDDDTAPEPPAPEPAAPDPSDADEPVTLWSPAATVTPHRREVGIQAVAVVALAWGMAYLVWRLGWTGTGAQPVLFVVLVAAELLGWVNLAFYTFLAWHVPDTSPVPPGRLRTVDVVVPTYDESVDVLRATLLGCRALTYPHRTWLLDDGRRSEMRDLANELGVEYVTRPDNAHAKAGNINHALPLLEGELIALLDADHVPLPSLLEDMVGHFEDPEVVLVQCPHEFYNSESVQHVDEVVHEQSLFFRVLCPGKDRHNAVFWAGSGTVLRREALVEIGGVQTATIAEDFHTSICLHQQGWRTRYVDKTLILGLAPHDLDAFLLQRSRWARGNLRVFLTRQNPFWAHGLRVRQRISYLGSLFHYFGGPQRLALLAVLCATLLTGLLPLRGPIFMFALLWAPWLVLSLLTTRLLGRGTSGPVIATRHGWLTMGIYTTATLSLLLPGVGRFKVTPKQGIDEGGLRVLTRLRLLSAGIVALVVTGVARALQVAGLVDLRPLPEFAEVATLVIAVVELVVILLVLRGVVQRRQRRVVHRFPTEIGARVGDALAMVTDLNGHGAGLVLPGARQEGDRIVAVLRLPGLDGDLHEVSVEGVVRSLRPLQRSDGSDPGPDPPLRVGVEFTKVTSEARDRLLEYCHVLLPATRSAKGGPGGEGVDDGRPAATTPSPATALRTRDDGTRDTGGRDTDGDELTTAS
jgi:cellulose synthase (UDP-forming)